MWYMPKQRREWTTLCMAVYGKVAPDVNTFLIHINKGRMPETITSKRDTNNWFRVYGYDNPEDREP